MDFSTFPSGGIDPRVNLAVYLFLPPKEAQYQLEHIEDSKVTETVTSHIICLAVAVIAVVLRFIARRLNRARLQADDWMIIGALASFIAYTSMVLLCVLRYGAARHAILLKEPIKFAKAVLAAEVLYGPSISLTKFSTLALYGRIFPSRRFRWFLWTIGLMILLYTMGNMLSIIFQCNPIKGAWDPMTRVTAKCVNVTKVFMGVSALNVISDLVILAAPLPMLWRLQTKPTTKMQLIGLFCIGGFVTGISIYRIPTLRQISLDDGSWTNAEATIWTEVEVSVAIFCNCAITYRPLFKRLLTFVSPTNSTNEQHGDAEPKDPYRYPAVGQTQRPQQRKVPRGVWSRMVSHVDQADDDKDFGSSQDSSTFAEESKDTATTRSGGISVRSETLVTYDSYLDSDSEREDAPPRGVIVPARPKPPQQIHIRSVEVDLSRDLEAGRKLAD